MILEFTQENIAEAARQAWEYGKKHSVWAFAAPMGAGKTTFISTLCREVLGVKDVVSSPTFAIINQYQSGVAGTIYHMDWYRLKGEEEAVMAGVEECLTSGYLCLVEWPEKAAGLLPEDSITISIQLTGADSRIMNIE